MNTGTPIADFMAMDGAFMGGINVAAGNMDSPGAGVGVAGAEIIVGAKAGGGPRVQVFTGIYTGVAPGTFAGINTTPFADFFAFPASFTGGVNVGAGKVDFTSAGTSEFFAGAGPGGGSNVVVYSSTGFGPGGFNTGINTAAPVGNFFAFDSNYNGGVTVGFDANGGVLAGTQTQDSLVISFLQLGPNFVQNFGGGAGLALNTLGVNISS